MPRAHRLARLAGPLAVGAALLASAPAAADSLVVDPTLNSERGFTPVEELSYEVIVEGMVGFRADLRVRVALHNASARPQDVVLSLALPRGAELHGLRAARGGTWFKGNVTDLADEPGRRDPGTIMVRSIPPAEIGDLPGAEVVAFSLDSGATTQVELQVLVPPRMRGDRWELELPERGESPLGLVRDRRVLVSARDGAPRFWLDGAANDGAPFMLSRAGDRAVVAWPALLPHGKASARLAANVEAQPDPTGRAGTFRLHLRLGEGEAARPDHIVALIDRSRSTSPAMHREAIAALGALFDALPAVVTFDAIAFARRPHALVPAGPAPSVRDAEARRQLAIDLDAGAREQGTDLAAAMALVGQHLRERGARRPLVLVITDGMLPAAVPPAEVAAALHGALGGSHRVRPEILFVVDEPLLARQGLAPDHAVATMAAGLGARISLETLTQHTHDALDLLAAPRVLSDLRVDLPRSATLTTELPSGLVAGNFVVVEGEYQGARPPTPRVRGRLGGRPLQVIPKVERLPAPPVALVASVGPGGPDAATKEGFCAPPWLTRHHQRLARLSIMWAGRGGQPDRGHLDERIFRRYLGTRVFPRARACYNLALTRDQTLGGRVQFEIEVGKGEVLFARVASKALTREDAAFEACLLEAAWALDIPAGQLDDQTYRVSYPLVFNPPAGGRPPLEEDPLGPGTVELLLHGLAPARDRKDTPASAPTSEAPRPEMPPRSAPRPPGAG